MYFFLSGKLWVISSVIIIILSTCLTQSHAKAPNPLLENFEPHHIVDTTDELVANHTMTKLVDHLIDKLHHQMLKVFRTHVSDKAFRQQGCHLRNKYALGIPNLETQRVLRKTLLDRLVRDVSARVDSRAGGSQDGMEPSPTRPPYALTGAQRPRYRGSTYKWLHRTRAWYILAAAYVAAACLSSKLSEVAIILRILTACATSLNVWLSDGYHNPDLKTPNQLSAQTELKWIRGDFLGISLVLCTTLWLWSSNVGWAAGLKGVGVAGGICTALVGLFSLKAAPKNAGYVAVQVLMAVQFIGLLGYLVWAILSTPTLFHSYWLTTLIYFIYAPGFVLYILKWPKNEKFGYHEGFHTSVIAGHVASMLFDLRYIWVK